ncbi:MAG: TrkA family potassium uptake protein [Candidatus Limiplasma sp.]|nr:TrkA family potassium uptake protein [Candidatus Limiplasma sp.]
MSPKQQKSYGVVGLGRFGMALAIKLALAGAEVIGVDSDENKVKELRAFTEHAFVISDLGMETLRETGIQNCDTVIVCIGEKIDASILTTFHVVQLGVKNVISKATTDDHGNLLAIIGAQVVYPERDMAERLASKLVSTSVMDYISISNEVDISEVRIGSKANGQSIRSIDFRKRFSLNVIALIREGKTIIEINPDEVLRGDDVIAVIGKKENISRFEDFLSN